MCAWLSALLGWSLAGSLEVYFFWSCMCMRFDGIHRVLEFPFSAFDCIRRRLGEGGHALCRRWEQSQCSSYVPGTPSLTTVPNVFSFEEKGGVEQVESTIASACACCACCV